MSAGRRLPSGACDALDVLDASAGHVIAARALLMTLPTDGRDDLRALTDVLLAGIGRRIAAELPPSALGLDAPTDQD